jgi:hypothetical protein
MSQRRRRNERVRTPRLEALEDRRLLATVNTLLDVNANDGLTTLREAIAAAVSGETIDFSVTGTISLSSLGELVINKNLTINGPGAGALTIRAFAGTAAVGAGARIFNVSDGNLGAVKTVAISGLTLTGGDVSNAPGGAIRSYVEDLTLTASTITGNRVTNGAGGAVWQLYQNLTINACTDRQ